MYFSHRLPIYNYVANYLKKNHKMWIDNDKYNIILASASPRRKEIMTLADVKFTTMVIPDIDESYPKDLISEEVPIYISKKKAEQYKQYLKETDILITCDTIVYLNGCILGKPKDFDEAYNMLSMLSGKTHSVISGVSIVKNNKMESFCDITEVTFSDISDSDIRYYLDKYKPYDKAGAYGIQEWIGLRSVCSIKGSFYNVMGLPIDKILNKLSFVL